MHTGVIMIKPIILVPLLTLVIACSSNPTPPVPATAAQRVAELEVVDCLLPGQIRGIGNRATYLTARRPVLTTAADCAVRGGEYVLYDRADYRSALEVWMPSAEAGDAEAQAYVGEIFERGLGGTPNYEAAAIWYQRAADQGNSRAQFNLGTLYEQGLGVEQDRLTALNLYRQAWGLDEDDVVYQSMAARESNEIREQLEQQIDALNAQIDALQNTIEQQRRSVEQQQNNDAQANRQIQQLQNLVAELEQERQTAQVRVTALPIFREPVSNPQLSQTIDLPDTVADVADFGNYYALVIGNQNYQRIEDLQSPINDARRVGELLSTKYGFSVRTLLDAGYAEIFDAINDLNEVLTENDNLLIFYAGHGTRIESQRFEEGYWLPIDADPPPTNTFWVDNERITRHLARLNARRILVVADSCYGGLLSDEPGFIAGDGQVELSEAFFNFKLPKRARLLLSSGGDRPVLDNAGGNNSVFARAFLEVLESNTGILRGPELFLKVRDIVSARARAVDYEQEPEFKAIRFAGHEAGDFFFVPQPDALQ